VLRSASNNKNEVSIEPLNKSTAGQPAVKRRKSGSSFEVGSPVSSPRVLRSTSERKNEASSEPLNDSTAAQPTARKRKGGAISKTDSPKIDVRVLRSASGKKNEACSEPVNDSTSAEPTVTKRRNCKPSKDRSPKKDYLKVCQRVRYILNRMNYQQTFIQAYASEGWKGQRFVIQTCFILLFNSILCIFLFSELAFDLEHLLVHFIPNRIVLGRIQCVQYPHILGV
jgi:remodeling and spacing factor 1